MLANDSGPMLLPQAAVEGKQDRGCINLDSEKMEEGGDDMRTPGALEDGLEVGVGGGCGEEGREPLAAQPSNHCVTEEHTFSPFLGLSGVHDVM